MNVSLMLGFLISLQTSDISVSDLIDRHEANRERFESFDVETTYTFGVPKPAREPMKRWQTYIERNSGRARLPVSQRAYSEAIRKRRDNLTKMEAANWEASTSSLGLSIRATGVEVRMQQGGAESEA